MMGAKRQRTANIVEGWEGGCSVLIGELGDGFQTLNLLLDGCGVVVIAMDAGMASELVGAAEAFLAEGKIADKGLFAGVGSDVAGL